MIVREQTDLGVGYAILHHGVQAQMRDITEAVGDWHRKHGPARAILTLSATLVALLPLVKVRYEGVHEVRLHERASGPYVFIKERTP